MPNPVALIIEDDEDLAHIFAEALRKVEFETEIVADGQKALERLAATKPALVLLDLHLPYVSGTKILRHIRDDERLAQTQVIVTTADPLKADALREEADLILVKPISVSQLRTLAGRLYPR